MFSVILWIKYWLMWFESLLVFILFKFKKRPNISGIQVVFWPLCVFFYFHKMWGRGHNNTILLRAPIWPAAVLGVRIRKSGSDFNEGVIINRESKMGTTPAVIRLMQGVKLQVERDERVRLVRLWYSCSAFWSKVKTQSVFCLSFFKHYSRHILVYKRYCFIS